MKLSTAGGPEPTPSSCLKTTYASDHDSPPIRFAQDDSALSS
jgi:hypothetical protein